MSTYKHLVERFDLMVMRLVKFSGLERDFVANVVRFCQCLVKPNEQSIDLQIYFLALSTYFDFMDQTSAMKIYERIARNHADGQITVEDFAKILCVFFSDNLDIKIDHVFTLYDFNLDGQIDKKEVSTFLKECWCISDTDDADKDETYFDLCTMATETLGVDKHGINLEEFRAKVKDNPLILYILCQSLPPHDSIERFRHKLQGKTNLEMKEIYGNIRFELLYEPPERMKYYPILLDLP